MAKYKVEIPDKLLPIITDLGFDVQSWFTVQCINPLLERYRKQKEDEKLQNFQEELDVEVDEVKQGSSIKQEKDKSPTPQIP